MGFCVTVYRNTIFLQQLGARTYIFEPHETVNIKHTEYDLAIKQ